MVGQEVRAGTADMGCQPLRVGERHHPGVRPCQMCTADGRRSVKSYEAHVIRQGCLSGPSRESVHRSLKTVSSSRLPDNTALVSRSST